MFKTKSWLFLSLVVIAMMVLTACGPAATTAPTAIPTTTAPTAGTTPAASAVVVGMVLVGPYNDLGWSEATYDGVQYALGKIPGSSLKYIDNSFNQKTTPTQQAEQLLTQGANVIIFNSDSFMDDSNGFAAAHPTVPVIMLSGDQNWADGQNYKNIPNMIDIMGRMEYMKEIAGCAAALTTQTGKIGFLGPLINSETRRLADSAFLGAQYCWTKVLNKNASDLTFSVTWIGNWFNIPGQTLDPTQVADNFYNTGFDVVISGIDTTEALAEAKKMTDAGKKVFAISYDFKDGCQTAPAVCLGVPYFNWGPALLTNLQSIQNGSWKPHFEWNPPDWANFNSADTGAVGFTFGQGLTAANLATLNTFVDSLKGGLNLWTGPITLQDGTVYLKDGEVATDQQIWYAPQLLKGMDGKSS